MEQTVENFHGCYLLCSENPKFKGRTYIGYTVDPNRRQKQHNLGHKHGGAYRTSRKGPWTVIVIVYGFMTNISALQFEWAWQHPDESRRLRHVEKKKSRENALAYRLRVLAEMLYVAPWKRLPLTVQWLNSDYQVEFPVNLQPPVHIPILSGSVKTSKVATSKVSDEVLSDSAAGSMGTADMDVLCCKLCNGRLEEDHSVTCLLPACSSTFHLICLSKDFLSSDPGNLIPLSGKCPSCKHELLWADLIRFRKGFYRNCIVEIQGLQNELDQVSYEEIED